VVFMVQKAGVRDALQERETIAKIEDREEMLDAVLKIADMQYPDNMRSIQKIFTKNNYRRR